MWKFLLIFGLSFSGNTFCQNFRYPEIGNYGSEVTDFIPPGWQLLDSANGDLNSDGLKDLTLVLQFKDSINLFEENNEFEDPIITQPRMLVILFQDRAVGKYSLVVQNNHFVLNHDQPNMDDPYNDISISKGVLTISFRIFMNAGGWGISNNIYKFRFQENRFVLIGADYNYLSRNTGEIENRSYNFLTRRIKIQTGDISSDLFKTKWKKLKLSELKTFETFQKPFSWEVEDGQFL